MSIKAHDALSGYAARETDVLARKQNDRQAVVELTGRLQEFDPEDPVKYDYALFGMEVAHPKSFPKGRTFTP